MTDVSDDISTDAEVSDGTYHGQLETEGDRDWIAVELTAGVTYTFRALGADSDNGTAQYLNILGIYNGSGDKQSDDPEDYFTIRQAGSYFTTEAQTSFTPAASGTYYVAVDGWGDDLGSYTLYVTEDQVATGGDNDTLTGGAGNDWIQGGCGDDVISGGGSADFLDGEWGNDQLTGGEGADTFTFYSGNWDAIRGDAPDLWGNDTITDFDPAEDIIHFAGQIIRGLQDLAVTEVNGNTVLTADWGDSVTLIGITPDQLSDDNFKFRVGVRLSGGNLEGGAGDDTLVGGDDANDTIYGHGGDDLINGGAGDDYLRGFEGDDTISGGDGDDIIGGEEGNNRIFGGEGADFIIAHGGNDFVEGGEGADLIETRGGADTLAGGGGGDTLRGGQGNDLFSGGAGADYFVLGRAWGNDTITDFDVTEDRLDMRGTGLDLEDLVISGDGGNTIITSGANRLTLQGVDVSAFEAAADDVLLEAGDLTSHYTEYASTHIVNGEQSDVLQVTGVVNDSREAWVPDDDGITRVTFSFIGYESNVVTDANSRWWYDAAEPVTPLTQYTVEQEIQRIEGLANIDLVWVEDGGESGGNIRLGYHQFIIGGGSTTPYEGAFAADVFVGIHVGEEFQAGYFIHELGHSLGFDDLPNWNELTGTDYTIMSYVVSARHEGAENSSVTTDNYQWADIEGLQYLYGVNTVATAGNSKYVYDISEGFIATLFDAGGYDSISVTGDGAPVHIDLRPGNWSDIGEDISYNVGGQPVSEPGTLFIMPGTIIEKASGSDGNDTLTGNDANNVLVGMGGDDIVRGGAGNDTVWAGAGDEGDDLVFGGAGKDLIAGGAGDDTIIGETGFDIAYGGTGNDLIVLDQWDDDNDDGKVDIEELAFGAISGDIAYVGSGDDTIHGTNGANALGGGTDHDLLYGWGGNDILYGGKGAGNDTVVGGAGNDTIFAGAGDDSLSGEDGDDILWSGAGTDTVSGGDGDDTMWGGGGDDTFTGGAGADLFAFGTAHGSDVVTDFDPLEDILNVRSAGFASFDDFIAAATETAGDVVISFADTVITLQDIELAGLSEANVLI